jgi:predicted transcriptional regulator
MRDGIKFSKEFLKEIEEAEREAEEGKVVDYSELAKKLFGGENEGESDKQM